MGVLGTSGGIRRSIATALTVVGVLSAACSSTDSQRESSDPSGPAPTTPESTLVPGATASDRPRTLQPGVGDDVVRVVVLSPAAGGAAGLGIDTSTDVTVAEAFDALTRPVNESGGVHGRRVDVEIVEFDPLDPAAQRAACLAATEDREPFVVLNTQALFGDAVLCIVEQHETIFMEGDGFTPDFYARSQGRLFSTVPSKHRSMAVAALRAHELDILDGATIGIVGTGDISGAQAVDDVLVPTLAELGYDIADIARLSSDVGEIPAQVPPAVERMRAAGADVVFLVHNVLANGQFVSEADAIGWSPQWIATDAAQGVSDLAIGFMPPAAYDGAVGVTSTLAGSVDAGEPETDANRVCRQRIESGTGATLTRVDDDGNEPPAYASNMILCNLVDTVLAGLDGAGPELDERSFIAAVEDLSDLPLANHGGTGSYRADKHDAPDAFRVVHFEARCSCWVPDGPFDIAPE